MYHTKEIYGKLKDENTYVFLNVAESLKEQTDIQKEYSDVYGNNIEFWEHKISVAELNAHKQKAFINLMSYLKN